MSIEGSYSDNDGWNLFKELCKLLFKMEQRHDERTYESYGDLNDVYYCFISLHKKFWENLNELEKICQNRLNLNVFVPVSNTQSPINWNELSVEFQNILNNPQNDWNILELNEKFPIFYWDKIIQNLKHKYVYPPISTQFDFMGNILANKLGGFPLNYFEISKREELTSTIIENNPEFLWDKQALFLNKSIELDFLIQYFIVGRRYEFIHCPKGIYTRDDLTFEHLELILENDYLLDFNELIHNKFLVTKKTFIRANNIYKFLCLIKGITNKSTQDNIHDQNCSDQDIMNESITDDFFIGLCDVPVQQSLKQCALTKLIGIEEMRREIACFL